MHRIAIAIVLAGTAAASTAQIATQRPVIPIEPKKQPAPRVFEGVETDAGPYQPTPAEIEAGKIRVPPNIGVSRDRSGWIASIDGKGPRYGTGHDISFSLGSEHVLRGKGFDGFVSAFITSSRLPAGQGRYETVGSVLVPVRRSDTELVLRVTQIAAGKIPWASSGAGQKREIRLRLTTAGGGRTIEAILRNSSYRCATGEPNCV